MVCLGLLLGWMPQGVMADGGSGGSSSSSDVADILVWAGLVAAIVGGLMQLGASYRAGKGWFAMLIIMRGISRKVDNMTLAFGLEIGFVLIFTASCWNVARNSFFVWLAGWIMLYMGASMGPKGEAAREIAGILFSDLGSPAPAKTPSAPAQSGKPGTIVIENVDSAPSSKPQPTAAPAPLPAPPKPVAPDLIGVVKAGDLTKAKELLAAGADVNARDADGWNPLMHASSKGQAEIVRALLDKGADVKAADAAGWTALMLASYGGNRDVVAALVEKGADVNAKTGKNTTALICASGAGHAEVVQILIDAHVDVNAKDMDGKTAMRYAKDKGRTAIVELLTKAGATVESQ